MLEELCKRCNRTFVENRKYVEVLVAVDTPWQGDLEACGSYRVIKRGEVKRSGAGLESGGQSALEMSERPLLREDIQSKNCLVHSCVYAARESVW
jgi:hypothetical protein